MDLQKLLSDLKAESNRIGKAIEALVGIGSSSSTKKTRSTGGPKAGRRRGGITPAGRRRLSLAMKKRWAERRKKSS